MDKRKLSKKAEVSDYTGNSSTVTLEALHQLAASYFIDRESTLRKLHHIQIASTAIKVAPSDLLFEILGAAPGTLTIKYSTLFSPQSAQNQVQSASNEMRVANDEKLQK